MAMKEYFSFPRGSELESQDQMQFIVIPGTLMFCGVLPTCRTYSQRIASPTNRAGEKTKEIWRMDELLLLDDVNFNCN